MEHNFLPHPHKRDKCIIQICDYPFSCNKCSEMIEKINKIRFEDFMDTIEQEVGVYKMSARILPTDFHINFQNFNTIETLLYMMIDKTNSKVKKSIKSSKILILTHLEDSLYYSYPILCIDFYFFGNLNHEAIRFLTDLGRNAFPLQTGDVGIFEKSDKSIRQVELDINEMIQSEMYDPSDLFNEKTHNIYGTQNLKSQMQYLSIFHIHQVEFDERGEFVVPNFVNHLTHNPYINSSDNDLQF